MNCIDSNVNNKGFTLIELIIVLAIITILGAIAVPNFLNISSKTRLKADIESARTIQNAKDLYEAESGESAGNTIVIVLNTLVDNNYLKKNYHPQTDKAFFTLDTDDSIKLNISQCSESIKKVYDNLNEDEKTYVLYK
jgi:type IV pilus assembly protein PilA